jgi:hypothetical protein
MKPVGMPAGRGHAILPGITLMQRFSIMKHKYMLQSAFQKIKYILQRKRDKV